MSRSTKRLVESRRKSPATPWLTRRSRSSLGFCAANIATKQAGEKICAGEGMAHVAVGFTSSGQQESLWILNLILIFLLSERKVFLVIEEPEAHLFPEAQTEMVRLIVLLANQTNLESSALPTAPMYWARSTTISAHQLGQRKRWAVERILPEAQWLDLIGLVLADGRGRHSFHQVRRLLI